MAVRMRIEIMDMCAVFYTHSPESDHRKANSKEKLERNENILRNWLELGLDPTSQ